MTAAMIGFVIYIVLVWYLAYRYRRRWVGFGVVAGGFAGLVFLGYLHWMMSEWTHGRIYLPVLQVLLYPYTLLVGAGGVFMVSMPKMLPFRCASCGYDLEGLEGALTNCPECGRTHALEYHRGDACHGCGREMDLRRVPAGGVVTCKPCGLVHFVPRATGSGYYGAGAPAARDVSLPVQSEKLAARERLLRRGSAAEGAVEQAEDEDEQRQAGRRGPAERGEARRGDVLDDGDSASGGRLRDEIILPA